MVEFSEAEERRAREIVESLLSEDRPAAELERQLSIADVERDAAEFRDDLDLLDAIGAKIPAIRIGDDGKVPVALSTFGFRFPFFGYRTGRRRLFTRDPYYREMLYYALRDGFVGYDTDETMSTEEARSSFLRRATEFLAIRIAALRPTERGESDDFGDKSYLNMFQRVGGPRITTPGSSFFVSSNSRGLRVFWSGAYYISGNYFGHPTSPTVGVLQAGSYVFGVDGGAYGNAIQWDTSAICQLPGKPSVHLNY